MPVPESESSEEEMGPLTAIVIGAGNRGDNYSEFSLDYPERLQVLLIEMLIFILNISFRLSLLQSLEQLSERNLLQSIL